MNPLQRAAVRRKIIYLAAIVGLFSLSMFWRGTLAVGSPGRAAAAAPTAAHRAADWLGGHAIRPQAEGMELRELQQGEAELSGEAMRLLLTGSKGFVTAYWWRSAIEAQKRGDLAKLEKRVKDVTKLQPHFITPWLFQGWNIAYNVSVEQHRLGDMYFYIARGIELQAEGERRNKRSPDLRYWIGFTYQNKFGVSDKVQTLRCLFQMSSIPPSKRSPKVLRQADGSVNAAAFEAFCQENPHLVRRLKEKLNCTTPDDVVQFLETNEKVPTQFKNATELAAAEQRFPVLPLKFDEGPDEWNPERPAGADASAFLAARAWYAYSLTLVPPNPVWDDGRPIPAATQTPGPPGTTAWGEYDSAKYRVPRAPMLIIFRQGSPRSESFEAELHQKEGWFDEAGWRPDEGADERDKWFPGRDVALGTAQAWSLEAWREASKRWQAHGERNGLIIDEARWQRIREAAGTDAPTYRAKPTPAEAGDKEAMHRYMARVAVYFSKMNRQVTNFPFFLTSSHAEMQAETVRGRKGLWAAEQARLAGDTARAIGLYADALARWKTVLAGLDEFRQLDAVQEDTYEAELRYLRLLTQDDPRVRAKAQEQYERAVRAVVPFAPQVPSAPDSLRQAVAEREFDPLGTPQANGEPWINPSVKDTVRARQGTAVKPAAGPAGAPGR